MIANDNMMLIYAGLNAGGGFTVYDNRPNRRPVLDFHTTE